MRRVSRLGFVISVVLLMIVVLFTMTVDGLTGALKRLIATKANNEGAIVTPRGGQGAQPMCSSPTRQ